MSFVGYREERLAKPPRDISIVVTNGVGKVSVSVTVDAELTLVTSMEAHDAIKFAAALNLAAYNLMNGVHANSDEALHISAGG